MTLSVPLPKKTRLFIVHMFWMDVSVKPRMIKLPLPTDANLELLKASLGRKIFLHMTTVRSLQNLSIGMFYWAIVMKMYL